MQLAIQSLSQARREHFRAKLKGMRYTHALQILDADELRDAGAWPHVAGNSLRLLFEDMLDGPEHFSNSADYRGPTDGDIAKIITFARSLPAEAHVFVHCFAGIARSTAAALIIQASRGVAESAELRKTVIRRKAFPNVLMLRMADRLLSSGDLLTKIGTDICAEFDS